MKQKRTIIHAALALLLCLVIIVSPQLPNRRANAASPHLIVSSYELSQTEAIHTGTDFAITITLTNPSAYPARDVRLVAEGDGALELGGISTTYLGTVNAGASVSASYGLSSPASSKSGYYHLNLSYSFEDYNGVSYVETERIPIYLYGNRTLDEAVHPTLLLKKYETNETIYAGQEFKFTAEIENPTALPVRHVKVRVRSDEGAFLPKDGAGTMFLDRLLSQESKTFSFSLSASGKLEMRTYPLNLSVEYEDESGRQYQTEEIAYLPVKLEADADLFGFYCITQDVVVGSEAEFVGSVSNTGKADLYQVRISAGGVNFNSAETFIGTLPPGDSKNVDLIARVSSKDNSTLNYFTLTYYDADGNVYTKKQAMPGVSINESDYSSLLTLKNDTATHDTGRTILITVFVMLGIAGIVVWQVLRIRKKKKIEQNYR